MAELSNNVLKQARLEAGLEIDEISKILLIQRRYLIALEEGEMHLLPGRVYAVGYIRKYAAYLGIDPEMSLFDDVQNMPNTKWTTSVNLVKFNPRLFALTCLVLGVLCMLLWLPTHETAKDTLVKMLNTVTD